MAWKLVKDGCLGLLTGSRIIAVDVKLEALKDSTPANAAERRQV